MPKSMFEIILNGGLGNQLFGWALGFSASKLSGLDCRFNASLIEGREFDLRYFGVKPYFGAPFQKIQSWHEIMNRLYSKINSTSRYPEYQEKSFNFDSKFLYPKKKVSYYGYFQSYKYFEFFSDEIKLALMPANSQSRSLEYALSETKKENYYALHVRRGDYINASSFHGLTSKSYYLEAKNKILELDKEAKFLLFSDSPDMAVLEVPWAEYRPDITENINSPETLLTMSKTKGIIGSNSSFSWWASFLMHNKSVKIFPKPWFAISSINTDDLIPKSWIQLKIS